MPFLHIVGFMVKWAFASIPAALIVGVVFFGCSLVFTLLVSALGLAGLGGLGGLR